MKIRSFHYLLGEGVKNIWSHRLMSVASAGVLMACMLMIGIMWAISLNITNAVDMIEDQSVVLAFFEDDMSREAAQATTEKIAVMDNIKSCVFVSREEGLQRQKDSMGEEYAALFDWVESENPLPDSCQITLEDLDNFDQTILAIRSVDGVETVRQQRDLVNKLSALRSMINIIGVCVIALLLIISLVIVSNTIKITMYTRRLEINIMKAVGATDGFIRTPFVIEGMLLGVIAGIGSTGILYLLYKLAETSFARNFGTVAGFVPFTSFALPLLLSFVIIGGFIGSLGSVISIGKYLRHEGSEFNAIT
ncbi:MAG: permease-like cell division protein FtsX [Clostridia bacterium]|nr:permease-like cell division protein FtsX [Clostridia bacterium]